MSQISTSSGVCIRASMRSRIIWKMIRPSRSFSWSTAIRWATGPGDFKEYLDLTEKYPALCGGFVWEWCDHAIYKGTAENGKAMYWYGGDHGELQHDGNFCLDGLVYPDRTPHTGLMEYKNVHRPLRASYDLEKQVLTLENHLDFTDPAERDQRRLDADAGRIADRGGTAGNTFRRAACLRLYTAGFHGAGQGQVLPDDHVCAQKRSFRASRRA